MSGECLDVERRIETFPRRHNRRKVSPHRVAKFEEAVGPAAGEVRDRECGSVQLLEDFLVDAGVLICLLTVDDRETKPQFVFHYRLDHRLEEILHVAKIIVIRVEQADREGPWPFERFQ